MLKKRQCNYAHLHSMFIAHSSTWKDQISATTYNSGNFLENEETIFNQEAGGCLCVLGKSNFEPAARLFVFHQDASSLDLSPFSSSARTTLKKKESHRASQPLEMNNYVTSA